MVRLLSQVKIATLQSRPRRLFAVDARWTLKAPDAYNVAIGLSTLGLIPRTAKVDTSTCLVLLVRETKFNGYNAYCFKRGKDKNNVNALYLEETMFAG